MRVVRLAQHPLSPAIAENTAAAAQPGFGQRGDRRIVGKKRDSTSSRVSLLLLNSTFTRPDNFAGLYQHQLHFQLR